MPGASRWCQAGRGRPGFAAVTSMSRQRPKALAWVAMWVTLGLLATACQGGKAGSVGMVAHGAAHHSGATVTIVAGNRSLTGPHQGVPTDRRPDLGIRVSVTGGELSRVIATTAGTPVPGRLGAGGTTWQSRWALAPGRTYRVTATAATAGTPGGRAITVARTFRTFTPRKTFTASTTITSGQMVGVGMPIMVNFSQAITDKSAVERALQIRSSNPVVGAWYWMGNRTVWFRTKKFWPAHTRVTLVAHLTGVRGASGMYGTANLSQHFRIGNSLIAVASAASHIMKVWWKGHLLGDWPISTGQPGDDTPDGNYLSFAMGNPVDMNSASYGVMPGDPGYYNVLVYDSVQFTYSGDYVHSAPWSVGQQGIVNVSHGCVNVGPANAAWYYDHSLLGDPISVVGSPLKGTWGDGWTIWFLPWRKLIAGSATGEAVVASAGGSRFAAPGSITRNRMHTRAVTGY
jgi:lipoprotein-anchoring transpeptidase ErfK/SrfK